MCPVFKNTTITRDDIGEFMKAYADQNDFISRPRRSLIGRMRVKKESVGYPSAKVVFGESF